MISMNKSSNIIYDNIRFLDEPIYPDGDEMDLAAWFPVNRFITIYTRPWKNFCENEDRYHSLLIHILHHESLHGIIDSIVEQDDIDFEGKDDHWPHMNGMDEPYINDWE